MKKILLMANRDFVLYNFRFELIQKLIEQGNQVFISLPYGPKVDLMVEAGAVFEPLEVDGRGKNIFRDLTLIGNIKKVYEKISPDIVLLFTTKIDIYGGNIARNMKIPYFINVSGLGTAVAKKGLLQKVLLFQYRNAVEGADCVFFQNEHNRAFFHRNGIFADREILIPGSGVNLDRWKLMEYPEQEQGINFLFVARLIKEKGIDEYLEAARRIKNERKDATFHVVGPCDGNYEKKIEKYESEGIITYHGMVEDTTELLKNAHCLVHPSFYPEGVSNVCLEAAACARPVITTDNPGCAETVEDNVTGFIVPARNTEALVKTIRKFLDLSHEQKRDMGIAGRNRISDSFDRNIVTEAYLKELGALDLEG